MLLIFLRPSSAPAQISPHPSDILLGKRTVPLQLISDDSTLIVPYSPVPAWLAERALHEPLVVDFATKSPVATDASRTIDKPSLDSHARRFARIDLAKQQAATPKSTGSPASQRCRDCSGPLPHCECDDGTSHSSGFSAVTFLSFASTQHRAGSIDMAAWGGGRGSGAARTSSVGGVSSTTREAPMRRIYAVLESPKGVTPLDADALLAHEHGTPRQGVCVAELEVDVQQRMPPSDAWVAVGHVALICAVTA